MRLWIELEPRADEKAVGAALKGLGLWASVARSAGGAVGFSVADHSRAVPVERILELPGVAEVFERSSPHPRVDAQAGRSIVIGDLKLGGDEPPVLMAGPCSVESEAQIAETAALVREAGGRLLRGGAFKPRTSPYAFDGHGREALEWMRRAAEQEGLLVITEALGEGDVELVADHTDVIQVGTRNMQNFALLRRIGATGKPVLLKRGMAARIDEWLLAGEHLLEAGAAGVIFCERGVSGFDPSARNLLDLAAVAVLKEVQRQPVVVDPSHATGRRDIIPALSRAALALGADGLLLEVHGDARLALSDGPQALDREDLGRVAADFRAALREHAARRLQVEEASDAPTARAARANS